MEVGKLGISLGGGRVRLRLRGRREKYGFRRVEGAKLQVEVEDWTAEGKKTGAAWRIEDFF